MTLPAETRVGRTALVVKDLEKVIAFYRDVVGLGVRSREGNEATLGAGGASLLELRRDEDARRRPRESAGLYHVAFRVPSRAALGGAIERVRSKWRLRGASDHLVSEALYLDDPEGNGVEIYRDRPREAWPIADDGRVEMDTLPLDLDDLAAVSDGNDSAHPDTTVGHVHLEVTTLQESREFYADALGLRIRQELGGSALFLAAGDYHHHVGANTWRTRTEPTVGRGLDWFELVVPDRNALSALRDRLDAYGADVTDRENGVAASDPDGIDVRVTVGERI